MPSRGEQRKQEGLGVHPQPFAQVRDKNMDKPALNGVFDAIRTEIGLPAKQWMQENKLLHWLRKWGADAAVTSDAVESRAGMFWSRWDILNGGKLRHPLTLRIHVGPHVHDKVGCSEQVQRQVVALLAKAGFSKVETPDNTTIRLLPEQVQK